MQLNSSKTSMDVLFQALSDRTRLRILHLLEGGELCVCELVDVLGGPQPKVSRHLAYLRKAGLVLARKEGLWSYYRLAPARGACHRKLLECLQAGAREAPEFARDARKLKRICRPGGCCPR